MTELALLLMVCAAQPGATEKTDSPHQAALRKLDFIAGKWQGPATYQVGKGEKQVLRQSEDVQFKLKGTVLLIEGTGRRAEGKPAPGGDNIVFNALAVVSYDPTARQYRVKAYTMEGRSVETELKLMDRGFVWGFPLPQNAGEIRHTMKLTEKGEWHEITEYSRDGKVWVKTVEMTLTRVKE